MSSMQDIKPGRGRKPLDRDDDTVIFSMRMTTAQRQKLDVLGGGPWIRQRIDRAKLKEPPSPAADRAGKKAGPAGEATPTDP